MRSLSDLRACRRAIALYLMTISFMGFCGVSLIWLLWSIHDLVSGNTTTVVVLSVLLTMAVCCLLIGPVWGLRKELRLKRELESEQREG